MDKKKVDGYIGLVREREETHVLHVSQDNTLWYGGDSTIKVAVFKTRKECGIALTKIRKHRQRKGNLIHWTHSCKVKLLKDGTKTQIRKKLKEEGKQ